MKTLLIATLLAPLSLTLIGCSGSNSTTPSANTINIFTEYGNPGTYIPNGGQEVSGYDQNPICTIGTSSCVNQFDVTTDSNGTSAIPTSDFSANWYLTLYPNGNCPMGGPIQYAAPTIQTGATQNLVCNAPAIQAISTKPSAITLQTSNNPTSIQIVSTTPLLPTTTSNSITVDSYNVNAQLETRVVSTNQSGGGTILTLPLNPALLTVGSHILAIQSPSNPNAYLGTALLLVYSGGGGGQPPTGSCSNPRVKCVALP